MQSLLIRADASPTIGIGHVMRMLALAQAWSESYGQVVLVTAECPPALIDRLRRENVDVRVITASIASPKDCQDTLEIAKSLRCGWIALDGYRFDDAYQQCATTSKSRLLYVDDLAVCKSWSADLVLNQNIFADCLTYYNVPNHRLLLGPGYALLRKELITSKPICVHHTGTHQSPRILVTLGGGDQLDLTREIITSINAAQVNRLSIRVLIADIKQNLEALRRDCENSVHDIRILGNQANMLEHYSWSNKIICAAGSTCLEWLYFRIPAGIVAVAENQQLNRRELWRRGLAIDLGSHDEGINTSSLEHFVLATSDVNLQDPVLVDGQGASRVAAAMANLL